MAHQHTSLERAPRQSFRRAQPAMAQEMVVHVHNIRITIEHAGKFLTIADRRCYGLKRVLVRECVAGIEKDDIVACSMPDAFIHRIIKSTILLRDDHDVVIIARLI